MVNEIFKIEISANMVAWYGAIVATLSVAFSAFQVWRDSSRIKISLEKGLNFYNSAPLYKENVDYVGVNVVNNGRRPIKITHAALLILEKEGKQLLLADSFADHRIQVLTEENPKTQFFVEASLVDINKIWCIVISDGTGRSYRKYMKKFPTILRLYYALKKHYAKK